MLNKVILIGRLGRDPETRQTNQGAMRCVISVVTDEIWKDKLTGEKQSKAEWHRVVFYNRLAEIASQYLRKGTLVYVEGKIASYTYTGKDNMEHKMYEILANEMKMLSPKPQHNDPYGAQQNYPTQNYGQYQPSPYPQAPSYAPSHFNSPHSGNFSSPNPYPSDMVSDVSSSAAPRPQTIPNKAVTPPSPAPSDTLMDDDVPF